MKWFTHPEGKFVIQIPTEWQYNNVAARYEEKSPFGFLLYENPVGAFQISCYSESEQPLNKTVKVQKANMNNLDFIELRMDGDGFNVHVWGATVEDHTFLAKYIYDTDIENDALVLEELNKARKALSTIQLISNDKRKLACDLDKYEKFMASLAASFDVKDKAIEKESLIEFSVIVANQIDAYLRLSLVMDTQLKEKSNLFETTLLHQGETDPPIMERKIYKQAFDSEIIDEDLFKNLESLYRERNKMVHQYIISEFKTRDLYQIAMDYETLCEKVRLITRDLEERQFTEKIGIYGSGRHPHDEPTIEYIQVLHSQVNDKHLLLNLNRKIAATNTR
jgi:hypothetical protein